MEEETIVFTHGQSNEKTFQDALLRLVAQGYRFKGTTSYKNSSGLVREVHVHFFKPGQ